MNNKVNFDKIYEDFFGSTYATQLKEEENIIKEEINIEDIDSLYITNNSKILLKKIINYMTNYKSNNIYVNFNIEILTNNHEVSQTIINLLNRVGTKSNYLEGNNINQISLYELEDVNNIDELYKNADIVIFKDFEALNIHDSNFSKKLLYTMSKHLTDKKITILLGNTKDINYLFNNDKEKEENTFKFIIEGTEPTNNEILNDIIEKLPNIKNKKIELLNYIEKTYTKSGLDYPTYRDNLIKYYIFNNELPLIEKMKTNEEVFKELNELVGLTKIKKAMYELVNLITLKKKTNGELKLDGINLHMLFLGNPGTGKTTVARMLSNILYNLGYIRQNKLIEVSSKDLVAEYVGQTAPKTMEVINRALGGILFIDEAYALEDDKTSSYNKEAIATLIKAMEDYRDDLVVIFAGYTKEMQGFINSNSGIASRIGYTFIFEDYTNEELKQIFKQMIEKKGFKVTKEVLDKLDNIIKEERNNTNFGNARFIRNIVEKTIINHATNTKNIKDKKVLKTINIKDI